MPYKALFIDLDNTLYDFTANSREAYQEVYDKMDYQRFFPSFDAYFDIYEQHNVQLWVEYGYGRITKEELNAERYFYPLQKAGVPNALALSQAFYNEAMKTLPTKKKLKPHVIECLEYLQPKYPLYILTNGFSELQSHKMHSAGIDPYFDAVILSDDIGINKPQRGIFDHALQVAHVKAEEALMIGDHFDVDIVGAKNAGWDQMYYNYTNQHPLPFQPTWEIQDLIDVQQIL